MLTANNQKLIVLYIFPLFDLRGVIWSTLSRSSRIAKMGTLVLDLWHCVILFLISSLWISKSGWYTMLAGAFLKRWTSMETLGTGSFPKGKEPKNSLPKVSSTSQHFATLKHLFIFLTTNLVKIFFFFSTFVFSFFFFLLGKGQ